jgi:peptidoglycan/LPS O-acetylase OafA/YrhL
MAETISARASRGGNASPRYYLIDLLRFGAASAVVLYHFAAFPEPGLGTAPSSAAPALFHLAKYGAYGVDLFFVISGFVILMSGWGRPTTRFVASRIGRLYPAYWVGVLLTTLVVLAGSRGTLDTRKVLVNLTMFQSAFNVGHVDPVYWTLFVELHFYVLAGIVLAFRPSTNQLLLFAAAWPIIGSLAAITNSRFVATSLISPHAALFASGMVIYLISKNGHSLLAWLVLLIDVAGVCAVSSPNLASSITANTGAGISSNMQTLLGLACIGLVAAATITPLRHVNWAWLFYPGAITYPLYLLHQEIGLVIARGLFNDLGRVWSTLAALLIVLGLSVAVFLLVERPLGSRLRRVVESNLNSIAARGRRSESATPWTTDAEPTDKIRERNGSPVSR